MSNVRKCTCDHAWMDEKYGTKMRVMNPTSKSSDTLRCTVCGKESGSTGGSKRK